MEEVAKPMVTADESDLLGLSAAFKASSDRVKEAKAKAKAAINFLGNISRRGIVFGLQVWYVIFRNRGQQCDELGEI